MTAKAAAGRPENLAPPGSVQPGTDVLRLLLAKNRPLVMGVLNVTPDSFSDGGRFLEPQTAIAHAEHLIAEGADILDVGAESTRPYGNAVRVPSTRSVRGLPPCCRP